MLKEDVLIVTRTPFRVSLFGGGTDFEEYYKVNGGEVISFTINKSMFVTVNKKFDGKLHIRYSKMEETGHVEDLRHDIIRECLKFVGVEKGVEIVVISDIPSVGTGLGSSGALTVGLLNALYTYIGKEVSREDLARYACNIEIGSLKHQIGKQDQWAVALGGINHIVFNEDGSVDYESLLEGREDFWNKTLSSLRLFYIPNGRKSSKILEVYKKNIDSCRGDIDCHRALVRWFRHKIDCNEVCTGEMGIMLKRAWEIKKKSSPASNVKVEEAVLAAMAGGASGVKVCGAGQGGFLLVVLNDECEYLNSSIVANMESHGFRHLGFRFHDKGSEIIYKD